MTKVLLFAVFDNSIKRFTAEMENQVDTIEKITLSKQQMKRISVTELCKIAPLYEMLAVLKHVILKTFHFYSLLLFMLQRF